MDALHFIIVFLFFAGFHCNLNRQLSLVQSLVIERLDIVFQQKIGVV